MVFIVQILKLPHSLTYYEHISLTLICIYFGKAPFYI